MSALRRAWDTVYNLLEQPLGGIMIGHSAAYLAQAREDVNVVITFGGCQRANAGTETLVWRIRLAKTSERFSSLGRE